MIEINVPVERFEEFRKHVAAVAKKFKVTGKIVKKSESFIEKVWNPNKVITDPNGYETRGGSEDHPVYACTIVIEDEEYAKFTETGATFVGSIHKEDVVTVGATPAGREMNLKISDLESEIENMTCASCGRKNDRRKVLYVFSEADGAIRTYGSTCAKTKFGVNFERLVSRFQNIKDLLVGGIADWSPDYTDANAWMNIALDSIKRYGYVSGTKAYETGETSTGACAWNDFHFIKPPQGNP